MELVKPKKGTTMETIGGETTLRPKYNTLWVHGLIQG